MGLAKTAELNGHPGPTHALELAAQRGLTPEQEIKTEVPSKKMQTRATRLGNQLVEEEHALDRLFESRTVNSESFGQSSARIGRLQGKVRQAHLDAHVERTGLLTAAQIEKYNRLRGYGEAREQETHGRRHTLNGRSNSPFERTELEE